MEFGSDGDLFNLRCVPRSCAGTIASLSIAGRCKKANAERAKKLVGDAKWFKCLRKLSTKCAEMTHVPCAQGTDDRGGGLPHHVAAAACLKVSALQQCLAPVSHMLRALLCANSLLYGVNLISFQKSSGRFCMTSSSIAGFCRDIKSSNIMLTRAKGHRIVKVKSIHSSLFTLSLCLVNAINSSMCQKVLIKTMCMCQVADFGSARSAISEGYHWAEQDPPTSLNPFIRQRPQVQVYLSECHASCMPVCSI